jgi:hypothetical protein
MKSNSNAGYRVGKYTVDLDLTGVVSDLLESLGKQKEKYLVHWLLLRLSGHQVELTKVLSGAFPELAKQIPRFYQKRVEDYRHSMRVSKLFGFRSLRSIEDEAVRRAWEDTRAMVKELSLARDESVKGLIEDHRDILRRLCRAMVELVMQEQKTGLNLDLERLQRFLEGKKP